MLLVGGRSRISGKWVSVDGTPSQIPAFDLAKASAKFEVAMSNSLGGDAFTRKYIISLLTKTALVGKGLIVTNA